jgi:hypothetical protein
LRVAATRTLCARRTLRGLPSRFTLLARSASSLTQVLQGAHERFTARLTLIALHALKTPEDDLTDRGKRSDDLFDLEPRLWHAGPSPVKE